MRRGTLPGPPSDEALLADPAVIQAIQSGDYTGLLGNPKIQALKITPSSRSFSSNCKGGFEPTGVRSKLAAVPGEPIGDRCALVPLPLTQGRRDRQRRAGRLKPELLDDPS